MHMKMRFFLILLAQWCLPASAYAEEAVTLDKPPASLQQWYKPANKRNVWHHNMFKLRREIQAINEYSAEKDQANTAKWASLLVTHYKKIGEMVPEWQDELELEWADKLEASANAGDYKTVAKALSKMKTSCKGCHNDYRAQVAAIFRAPDFSETRVSLDGEEVNYPDFMKILMRDVNRIVIYAGDGNNDKAKTALSSLRQGITTLRSSCDSCHKGDKAKNYYLGEETSALLDKLATDIEKGESGRTLGNLAVQACAHCHGSHRILYDIKEAIE